MNVSDISGTADEYCFQLTCLQKSVTSTLGYTNRKCAIWVPEETFQLSEKATEARMSGDQILIIWCFEELQ
ncbi:unnamed protein product [Dracunculus medinensis]|uniref:Uncharacterized protein n=1 Tax=Dracunculus medinensis TaxID=318479 RepID=A0A0N4U482_DRAME|nr:unnamed protein product [Dracunculus medinensis]